MYINSLAFISLEIPLFLLAKEKKILSLEIKYTNKSWATGTVERIKEKQGTHSGVRKSTSEPCPLVKGGKGLISL